MEYRIAVRPLGIDISASEDDSLLATLQNADIEIESICGGIGICGKCRIQVLEGNTSEPTLEEEDHLAEEMIAEGDRLACQTYPLGDLVIHIPGSSMQEEQRLQVDSALASSGDDPAVRSIDLDLGNITISTGEQLEWPLLEALRSAAPGLMIDKASLENTPALLEDNASKIRAVVWENRLMAITSRTRSPLGVAVDLGSTKVAVFLYDLEQPALLDSRAFLNPQARYGEDIISRLQFALTGEENAARLKNSITAALDDNLSQALALTGKEAADVYEMVVVGNTAMHHLFLGLPVRQLAMNPYIPAVDSPLELRALDLGLGINPAAVVFMPPPIAGFVGSDHLAALTASSLEARPGPCLLIDIGTNTEVALQVDCNISCCSCASGPAFEGGGLSQGMRAAAGAIERVEVASGSGDLVLSVIGACAPIGICGSGVVSAMSSMLEKGAVDPSGRLAASHESSREAYYCLTPPDSDHPVGITQSDIREIQKAKGAIRAGTDVLLREAGIGYRDLNEVLLAGAFGSYIDAESALAIALLPPVSIGKIIQVGNAAGAGAQRMLLSESTRREANALARRVEYVELATYNGFDLLFAADMFLGEGEVEEHKRRFKIP